MNQTAVKVSTSINCPPNQVVVKGLSNPRGLMVTNEGCLLVIEAGSGKPGVADGRVLALQLNAIQTMQTGKAQDIGDSNLYRVVIDKLPSMNMQTMMKRDEIMGGGDFATNGQQIVFGLTDYVAGSKVIEVSPVAGRTIFNAQGNLNSIVHHPQFDRYFSIKPDANVVMAFSSIQSHRVVSKLEDLSDGQDAVPVCVIYEPQTHGLLVSLFSGELHGDQDKKGIDFDKSAGQVVRVDIESAQVTTVLSGLTAPTGIALANDGQLYVLELCDDFLEPLVADNATTQCLHGGFKRFSGRLLLVDLETAQAQVVAQQLDTPSNLVVDQQSVFISEGMGMPNRPIPGVDGQSRPLEGFIRHIMSF